MWQSIATVAVALVGALAFVAYRHPDSFEKLLKVLRATLLWLFASSVGYLVGSAQTIDAAKPFFSTDQLKPLVDIVLANNSYSWTIIVVSFAAWIVFEFLGVLPILGIKHQSDK